MSESGDNNSQSEPTQYRSDSRPITDGGNRGDNRQPRGQQGGGQRRGQGPPQGGQPRQGRQQGGQPPQQPPQGVPRGGQQPQGGDDSRFTRRQLLAGGGAAAAAAGGWFFFLRGPSGAKGVIDDYVTALADNNWATAEELFHGESPVSQEISSRDDIDNFEDLLESVGILERAEDIEPSVDSLTEYSHYSDYTEETANQVPFRGPSGEQAGSIDELKRILAVFEVDASTWFGENSDRPDQLAGDTTKVRDISSVVSDGGGWSLWGNTIV